MKKSMVVPMIFFLCVEAAHAQVHIQGAATDCGDWVTARKTNRAIALENWVDGVLSGMSIATNKEFWEADGRRLSQESIYLWLDKYCQAKPLDVVITGVHQLFRERSGWQPKFER